LRHNNKKIKDAEDGDKRQKSINDTAAVALKIE
jgi:hypothetical protein